MITHTKRKRRYKADLEKIQSVYDAIIVLEKDRDLRKWGVCPKEIREQLEKMGKPINRDTLDKYLRNDLSKTQAEKNNLGYYVINLGRASYISDKEAIIKDILESMHNSNIIKETPLIELKYMHEIMEMLIDAYPKYKNMPPDILMGNIEEWYEETHKAFICIPDNLELKNSLNISITDHIIKLISDISLMIGGISFPVEDESVLENVSVVINFNPKKFEFKDPREQELKERIAIINELRSLKKI